MRHSDQPSGGGLAVGLQVAAHSCGKHEVIVGHDLGIAADNDVDADRIDSALVDLRVGGADRHQTTAAVAPVGRAHHVGVAGHDHRLVGSHQRG